MLWVMSKFFYNYDKTYFNQIFANTKINFLNDELKKDFHKSGVSVILYVNKQFTEVQNQLLFKT